MSTTTRAFLDLRFEMPRFNWRRAMGAWRARRLEAGNLARLSRRDVRDFGVAPAHFDFQLNHGRPETDR